MEETKINQGEVLDGGGEISQTNEGKNISQNLGFDTMLQYVMREGRRRELARKPIPQWEDRLSIYHFIIP